MNSAVLIGRLTKEPELRYMQGSGTAVCNFSLAIDGDYSKKDGTKETDFIPIEVIGKIADSCANYLDKGRLVAVQGSIRIDRYQIQSGENRIFTKVFAKSVQFLESKNKSNPNSTPTFNHADGLNLNAWQAVDDEIPF